MKAKNSQKGIGIIGIILIVLAILLVLFIIRAAQRKERGESIRQGFFQRLFNKTGTSNSSLKPSQNLQLTDQVGQVPSEYQALYTKLEGKLDSFISKIDSQWDGSKQPVVFSAGLVTSNPNTGDALLTPQAYDLTIAYLNSLQKLGIKGVGMDINFPLLDPNFRGKEKSDEYLNYYKKLVGEIKRKGLKVTIEVQPIFPDFSSLPVKAYYQNLSLETYKQRVAEMLKTIAVELHPDYLTVANEPSTAAGNTGLPLDELDVAAGEVSFLLGELKKLNLTGIKYGAGFGNWQENYQTWTESYTSLANLDFLNVHIYPADEDLLDRVLSIADIASKNGKKLAIHETWLYKWQLGEKVGIATSANIFARDAYSFWQPLDAKFMEVLVKLAHFKKFEYVSPFWSSFFFTYFNYNEVKDLPGKTMMKEVILGGAEAAKQGKMTETGKRYQELISN